MEISRRGFITGGVATLTGSAVAVSGTNAKAAKAPVRNGASHMKLSLAAYSFNRMLPRPGRDQKGEMTLEDFVDYCAKLNLDGTELTSYYFPAEPSRDYLLNLKEQTFRLGLDISGTAIGNDFCLPEGEKRQAQLKLCRDWIDHAAVMGAPVIRIFAGKVPKGGTEEEALDLCVAGINESLDYAAEKGVLLALENHGGITATPEQLLSIVERVKDSKWFGVNYDSGNFRTEDPYGDLEKIAPYAVNAQIKVALKTPNNEHREADLKRMVEILRAANYRGYVVLEYEEAKPYEEIPMYVEKLRELIG
ncbi:MAG: sugar phosphate isomerase/epimerase [Planctomycetota bacterium]|nr:sugar phosphate isomerase/epimerase [Planctomycetota bacterium]MDA0918899.1 sugar phosphate isomerase/epimerase [Planctomycetota bacterium]MDA1161097.1 sugar phosphate isomerase/epimerase [Planctomycetota bacterium]